MPKLDTCDQFKDLVSLSPNGGLQVDVGAGTCNNKRLNN